MDIKKVSRRVYRPFVRSGQLSAGLKIFFTLPMGEFNPLLGTPLSDASIPYSSSTFFQEKYTTVCFVTKLKPQRIKLDGENEVRLTEIFHAQNFINIDNSDGKYWLVSNSDIKVFLYV